MPEYICIAVGATVGVISAYATTAALFALIGLLGLTPAGPVAGGAFAAAQAAGLVGAGGIFATLQSIAMGGSQLLLAALRVLGSTSGGIAYYYCESFYVYEDQQLIQVSYDQFNQYRKSSAES